MAQRHSRGGSRGSGSPPADARSGRGDTRRDRQGAAAPRQADRPVVPAPNRVRLRAVIEPVVSAAGYDVEGLAVSRAGRRHLIRLTVDCDGGVNLDAVADVSRLVATALDDAEAAGEQLVAGEYELQVSSPGVDRPLTEPRHWRRNVGRLVQVRAGDKQLTGRITAADDTGVVLEVGSGAAAVPHELAHATLGAGRIQLEFARLETVAGEDVGTDEDFADAGAGDAAPDAGPDDDFEEDEA